ncbi:MAG: hypothetical protein F4219_09760 [Gammaproteobacteria bacterium]|nr:hypothetical protein [Gammaproteobacteria bacterium]
MSKKWRWLMAAAAVAAVVMIGPRQRVEACLLGTCDSIIIANQVTQIAQMVTQLAHMVTQIDTLDDVLTDTNELLTSNTYPMGHIGRLREIREQDFFRRYLKNGLAQSTALGAPEGLYSARIIGLSDEPGWLNVLAAPRLGDPTSSTVLLGGRPATETNVAEPSAFRTWPVPSGGAWSNAARNAAREAIDVLGDVAEGTATWRTVWDDIEAALPNTVRAADLRGLRLARAVTNRMVETWRRRERQAAAELQHAHAIAEAASSLQAQVGETAAHLGELRDDDLMGEERIDQAALTNGVTQTELLLAQAQLLAQEQAAAARARYEAERARREREARWLADIVRAETEMEVFTNQSRGLAARRTDSFQNALLGVTGL